MSVRQRINEAIEALQAGLAELDNPRKPADDTMIVDGFITESASEGPNDAWDAIKFAADAARLAATRVRKPRATGDTLEEVYDALCATPEPQGTVDVARRAHITQTQAKYALSRLRALGRAKSIGSKRGTKYLPLTPATATDVSGG